MPSFKPFLRCFIVYSGDIMNSLKYFKIWQTRLLILLSDVSLWTTRKPWIYPNDKIMILPPLWCHRPSSLPGQKIKLKSLFSKSSHCHLPPSEFLSYSVLCYSSCVWLINLYSLYYELPEGRNVQPGEPWSPPVPGKPSQMFSEWILWGFLLSLKWNPSWTLTWLY